MVADAYGSIVANQTGAGKPASDPTAEAYAGVPSSKALQRFDALSAARGATADSYAAIMPRTVVPIFNPLTAPCLGMFSGLAPSGLKPGQFSLISNLRYDDASLTARQPTTLRAATGLPGTAASARGLWSGFLNGVFYVIGAWVVTGGKVGIFYSTDGLAFTEGTAASGAYGNSRMVDPARPLVFATCNNIGDGLDYLFVQNGIDAPRFFGVATLNSTHARVIKQYSAPTWATATPISSSLNASPTMTVVTVDGGGSGDLTVSLVGSGPSAAAYLQIGVGVTSGDGFVITTTSINGLAGQQLLFASDQATLNAWANWEVQISQDDSTWFTVANPTSSTYNAPLRTPWTDPIFGLTGTTGGLGGEELVAFSTGIFTNLFLAGCHYVKLIWVGPTVTTAIDTYIHGIFGTGDLPAFGQTYAVTVSGVNGLSESPSVVYDTPSALSFTQCLGTHIPYLSGLYYNHSLSMQVPPLGDIQNGADTLNIYRQDLGGGTSDDFFFQLGIEVAEFFSGAWVYSITATTTPPAPFFTYFNYGLDIEYVPQISRYAPDAYAEVMPVGLAMTSSNGRLIVGGVNFYYASEYTQPGRFREQLEFLNLQPVERSATKVVLTGETVVGFATPSSSALASSTLFIFTQGRTYATSGFDGYSLSRPSCVAEIGCSAPGSIVQYKDSIFFLDDNQQLRKFSFGHAFLYGFSNAYGYQLFQPIGRRVVDDQTTGIPKARLPWVSSACTFDHLFMGYTPSGQTQNVNILVYDELTAGFVVDTALPSPCDYLAYADLSSGRALLLAGHDGNLYTHVDPAGTGSVAVELTTLEGHSQMWNAMFFGRIGIVCDIQAGVIAVVTRTIKPGISNVSQIDLATNVTDTAWRWDSLLVSGVTTQPGAKGLSCQVDLAFNMLVGTKIYALVMETASSLPGADQL